jgi:hypothetical protein
MIYNCATTEKINKLAYSSDVFEHLANCRVHHVVASVVLGQCVNDGSKEIAFNDVPVVELILEGHNFSHEPECT